MRKMRNSLTALLGLLLILGLTACGGETPETGASETAVPGTERSSEASPSASAAGTEAETTLPETTEADSTEAAPDEEELRAAVLAAAKASAAKGELERLQDAAKAVGADLSAATTGEALIKDGALTLFPGIAAEAPESLVELFDWMTAAWDGGYTRLQEDLITPEKREERLADYNEFNNTRRIIENYNTPQQVLRAYAKARPGDLLLGVLPTKDGSKLKLAAVIADVQAVFLPDGLNVDPEESRFLLIRENGEEKEMSFRLAFAVNFALPYRLTAMGEVWEDGETEAKTAEKAKLPDAPVLQIGFGRSDITSDMQLPLAGYGNTTSRMSDTTLTPEDRLTATAIALSDGSNTQLLFTMDTIRVPSGWSDKAAEAIEQATGIPAANIAFSSTHTHSGPDIGDRESSDQAAKAITSSHPYFLVWKQALVDAAAEAVKDLAPVTETGVAVVPVEKLNYVRHYRVAGGTIEGSNFEPTGGRNLGTPEVADEDMQLIRFTRADRKDVVLVNWQAHNNAASTSGTASGKAGRPYISADYAGYMRRYMEQQDSDCLAAFFLGASGNVIPSRGREAVLEPFRIDEVDRLGEMLGRYALAAMEQLTPVETGAVQGMQEEHVAFDDGYEGTVRKIEQNVITVGSSLAFVTAGYEMFNVNGLEAKARSPFAVTFVCTCGQGHEYMPSFQAHHYALLDDKQETAYEVKAAQCNVVPGTAEDLVDGLAGMLKGLWENLGLTEEDRTEIEPLKIDRASLGRRNLAPEAVLSYSYKRITADKYDPALLTDGSKDTALTSAAGWYFSEDGELLLDLGRVRTVSGYCLTGYSDPTVYGGPKSWILSVSADGSSWTELDTVAENRGKAVEKDFPESAEARYVKLKVTDAWENTKLNAAAKERRVIRITELELWGE